MRPLITALISVLCYSWAAHGQPAAGLGAVTGLILETPDSGLPEATVVVSNSALGLRRQVGPTDYGVFDIPALPPAAGYQLSVSRKDYADWESEPFELAVGQSRVFRIQMRKEGSSADTDVESRSATLLEQNGLTTWVDPALTRSMPSSRRQLDPLVLLSPAVSREAGGRITFQGVATSNSFLLDGITTTSGYFGERPSIAGPLTQDNVQELRVLPAAYPAEFGRAMGGIADAVSPTGSNAFHGAAFDYIRHGGDNAANRFAAGQPLLGKLSHAGATLGGPVCHDHLFFFFANLESLTGHFQGVNRITSQTIADPTGNGGLLGTSDSTDRTRYARAACTAAPIQGMVNELRLGLIEDRYFEGASQSSLASNVAVTVAGVAVGSVHPTPASLNEKRYQFVDNLTMTFGAHSCRLGADLSKTRDYLNWLNYAGSYVYPTLTAFAQDFSGGSSRSYTNFTQQFGDAARRVPYREVAAYGQDTWKASPHLEFTVGVRWEKTSFPNVPVSNPTYYQTGSIPSSNNTVSPRIGMAYQRRSIHRIV